VQAVLDIFRMKTAPAFEVALSLGAILAGCDEQVGTVLKAYSEALGIAYQIRDDLEDLRSPEGIELCARRRPSVLLALAYEMADDKDKRQIERQWDPSATEADRQYVRQLVATRDVEVAAWRLMETYKSQAIGALIALNDGNVQVPGHWGLDRLEKCRAQRIAPSRDGQDIQRLRNHGLLQ